MSSFWSAWIIALTIISLVLICWLLFSNRKISSAENREKTGHVYDGIEEYDNPMPAWWVKMFVLSIVFSVIYLIAYPGLGNFPGLLKWTSVGQWEQQVADAKSATEKTFSQYAQTPIADLAKNSKAMRVAKRVFANNCAACHGANGKGSLGYPNLTDKDWLYGGSPEQIKTTLVQGRAGVMPGWESVLGFQGLNDMTNYIMAMGKDVPAGSDASTGAPAVAQQYLALCSACHGANGQGNLALGAPKLTDAIWLYGGSEPEIRHSIAKGRQGKMPAQADLLGAEKIHLLTAYVYQLSQP